MDCAPDRGHARGHRGLSLRPMPPRRCVMKLSDTTIRNAKPGAKPRRLFDGDGLYVEITPSGGKLWRLKYRFARKEKRGARRAAARKLLADDIDPSTQRKAEKAAGLERSANSFEVIAREWIAKKSDAWVPGHTSKIVLRLENDVFPWIGKRPIAELTAPEILACLRRVEARGTKDTAHRILQNCGQIFRYAIATGRASRDTAADLRGSLASVKPSHHAAITDPQAIGGLLRAIDDYSGAFVTRCALRLAPLLFVRPGELRQAEWSEIDFDKAQWNIPAERMKTREPHLVPLSAQSLSVFRELEALTGRSRYVFPCARTPRRPMSNNAVLAALRRMGYAKDEMTGHGFRAMARTILDETLQVRPDYIEHQLAHAVRDPNGRAYNRTAHLAERRAMMQLWADYLDGLKSSAANIVPIHRNIKGAAA
jgi:integrase